MIQRWLALTYYLYALRLAALSHFYFNRLYWRRNATKPLKNGLGCATGSLHFLWHLTDGVQTAF